MDISKIINENKDALLTFNLNEKNKPDEVLTAIEKEGHVVQSYKITCNFLSDFQITQLKNNIANDAQKNTKVILLEYDILVGDDKVEDMKKSMQLVKDAGLQLIVAFHYPFSSIKNDESKLQTFDSMKDLIKNIINESRPPSAFELLKDTIKENIKRLNGQSIPEQPMFSQTRSEKNKPH